MTTTNFLPSRANVANRSNHLKWLIASLNKLIVIGLLYSLLGTSAALALTDPPPLPNFDPIPGTPDVSVDLSQTQINLSWHATDHAQYYAVYAYLGGQWQSLRTHIHGTQKIYDYQQKGWDLNTLQLKVRACKSSYLFWQEDKCSHDSNIVRLRDYLPLEAPVLNLSADGDKLDLSWGPIQRAQSYQIDIYHQYNWQDIATVVSSSHSLAYRDHWDLAEVEFRVRACDGNAQCGDNSNVIRLFDQLPKVNPDFSLSAYAESLSHIAVGVNDAAQYIDSTQIRTIRLIQATLRLRDTVTYEFKDIAWPVYLDAKDYTVTSNKVIAVKPGRYDIEFLATQGNVQYAARAMNIPLQNARSTISLALKTVSSDTEVTLETLSELAQFNFQPSSEQLTNFVQPAIGVKIDDNYETLLNFNPQMGITPQHHLISSGRHQIQLKAHDAALLKGRSEPRQEDRVIVAEQDISMQLIPLVGGITTTLVDGTATLNLMIPSVVVDEVGGDPNNLQVMLSLSGINNRPEDVLVDNLIYNATADAYEAQYTYSGLQADTQVAISLTFSDTSGVANELIGRCVANDLTLSGTQNDPCQMTVRRRAIPSNYLLAQLEVNVLDSYHTPVSGAQIYIRRQQKGVGSDQASLGTFVGLTSSGRFGAQGHLKMHLLPDNYFVTAQYLPLGASAEVVVPLSPSEKRNEDIILNGADTVPPVISLIGESVVSVYQGDTYEDAGATAHDNVDGDITSSISTRNLPVDTDIEGEHRITYDVADRSGNNAIQVTRTVNVIVRPEIILSPSVLTMVEGSSGTFNVHLSAQPSSNVVLKVESGDPGAASIDNDKAELTFTPSNWNDPQVVSVTGVEDDDVRDETVTIMLSVDRALSDDDFDQMPNQTVAVTVNDNDSAGFTRSPASLIIMEGGCTQICPAVYCPPGDRSSACECQRRRCPSNFNSDFRVHLTVQPTSDVVLNIRSSDTGAVAVSRSSLTFTPANWNDPQVVSVTGVEDNDIRSESVTVTLSVDDARSDNAFDPLPNQTVAVRVNDNDSAGFTRFPASRSINEGSYGDITVRLTAQPTSNVVLNVGSSDTGAVAVSRSSLTFTPANWNDPQEVRVTGVEDDDVRDETVTIMLSVDRTLSDDDFDQMPNQTVSVTVDDDEEPGFVRSPASLRINEGSSGSIFVRLTAQPTSNVVLNVTSSDPGAVAVSGFLTFTPSNWNQNQTVRVTGVEDDDPSDESVMVTLSVDDARSDNAFDPLPNQTVAVTVNDNDSAGFIRSPASRSINEGSYGFITVRLTAQPTSNVVLNVTSSDTGAATVSDDYLVFTAANWNQYQRITVSAAQNPNVRNVTVTLSVVWVYNSHRDAQFADLPDQTVNVAIPSTWTNWRGDNDYHYFMTRNYNNSQITHKIVWNGSTIWQYTKTLSNRDPFANLNPMPATVNGYRYEAGSIFQGPYSYGWQRRKIRRIGN